jgi:glyoxylase-like metal-dependent hydrolase (beta-lactamase superfamily II)
MKIEKIVIGAYQENCYLLETNNKYLLVDPGEGLDKILEFINGKDIVGILITHGHNDHIASLDEIVNKFNYPVYRYDNLKEGRLVIGPFNIEVIFVSGHTPDSVCYYFRGEKVMMTGDFLFKESIGRCDLEGGNFTIMKESINKIKKYDDDITIYPGHGDKSTLGYEKKYNYYF